MTRSHHHCPAERIVLCIDACEDRPTRHPNQQGSKQHSILATLKKCAEAFLLNKAALNPEHQFAMLTFKANLSYVSGFHNRVIEHLKQIHAITPNLPPDQPTQLSRLYQTVYDKLIKNTNEEDGEQLPLRIVLLYGRPGMCVMGDNALANYQNVVTDILFIHRPVLSAKEKKRITSNLSEMQKCLSEKSMCTVALSDSLLPLKYMMKFLTHPALRLSSLEREEPELSCINGESFTADCDEST